MVRKIQNLFRFSPSWCDPVPSLKKAVFLTLAIILVESSVFIVKDHIPQEASIYFLGLLRITDILILVVFGFWVYEKIDIPEAFRDSIIVSAFFASAGIIFLIVWKGVFGNSLFNLDSYQIDQEGAQLLAFYLVSCLFSPVAEELVFRGIIYRKTREYWNAWICTAIVSALFVLLHYSFDAQILMPLMGSFVFCIGYEKTKFILTPILLHVIGNIIIYTSPFIGFL